MNYVLTIAESTDGATPAPITIPFVSEDSTLDIATRVIAALNKRKRGPRKGSTRTAATGDGK